MPALLWFPETAEGSTRPALVVFQEIFGVSDYVQRRCAELADLGYAVLAPELYWRLPVEGPAAGVVACVPDDADDLLEQGMALAGKLDWDAAVRDGVSATAHLQTISAVGEVGLLGFCLGGGLAYATAAQLPAPPRVLVSYYGSALPTLTAAGVEVEVPSLHHFGTDDAFIPADEVARVREFVTRGEDAVRFELHEGANHAFDNPHPMFHHAEASERAWEQTVEFLEEHLPVQ